LAKRKEKPGGTGKKKGHLRESETTCWLYAEKKKKIPKKNAGGKASMLVGKKEVPASGFDVARKRTPPGGS